MVQNARQDDRRNPQHVDKVRCRSLGIDGEHSVRAEDGRAATRDARQEEAPAKEKSLRELRCPRGDETGWSPLRLDLKSGIRFQFDKVTHNKKVLNESDQGDLSTMVEDRRTYLVHKKNPTSQCIQCYNEL